VATNDKTGPNEEAVEGSWSPRRTKATTDKKPGKGEAASPDPDALAGDIEKTRDELAETLDAIADKVSPKRVAGRTKKAAKDGAGDAVESVKEAAAGATAAARSGVDKAKDKVSGEPAAEAPPLAAPTPGALADAAVVPVEPVGAEAPVYASTLPPPAPSRLPMYAGAGTAALVVLLLLRRRRR
jgi:hypothetical protein